ncbi:MAG: glycosyltransferase [Isosphaeraceae bacterium]
MSVDVAVIVASVDAGLTFRASLAGFLDEVRGIGDVILVDASRDGTADAAGREFPGLRIMRRPLGDLVPDLWQVGMNATNAPLLAFSTAAMRPRPGWLASLRDRLDANDAAAVGGPIAPGRGLSATDRAIYLHRYVLYLPPMSSHVEPPGENALYRRSNLEGLESLRRRGFWEAAVLRELRLRGDRLAMSDDAVLEFLGGARLVPTLRQRIKHARLYGAWRAKGASLTGRLVRSAIAPAVPALLLGRIGRHLHRRRERLAPWLSAAIPLGSLLTAWALGEAIGTLGANNADALVPGTES